MTCYESSDPSLLDNDLINVRCDEYHYLDLTDNWLTFDTNSCLNASDGKEITEWIRSAFCSERSRGTHMSLMNKLDELSPTSAASIDTRTFTRRDKQRYKRQSLFNGNALSSLCSPVNEDDYLSPEAYDRTFEVQSNRSLNGTFVKPNGDTTFTLTSDQDFNQLNNLEDVEKMAQRQEDSLRLSCSTNNGWQSSQYSSPNKSQLYSRNTTINSNTLTKSRGHIRQRMPEAMMNNDYHMNTADDELLDGHHNYDCVLSPVESFGTHLYDHSSTPLVPKNRTINYSKQSIRQPIPSKIMPDISNLKSNSSYGASKIGRSEPNLSRRLQPLGSRGMASKLNPMVNRTQQNSSSNRTFLESKMPSDSRLMVNRNGFGLQNHNHMQTVGRNTSPPPSQSQQILNRKVAVEGEMGNRVGTGAANTTNLCRKSTFRVRESYALNIQEDNGISDECLLANGVNNHASHANGFPVTNKIHMNNNTTTVQRQVSKIPGPKTNNRSGIPVCGPRTTIPGPVNSRPAQPIDNSWKNGCY